jgi:hypothetical protein
MKVADTNNERKKIQGYDPTPSSITCGKCRHFTSRMVEHIPRSPANPTYTTEAGFRCTLGNFYVKKTAVCDSFRKK